MLKIVIIVVLLLVAVHLLLYGYLQRRIDAAKREKDQQNRSSPGVHGVVSVCRRTQARYPAAGSFGNRGGAGWPAAG